MEHQHTMAPGLWHTLAKGTVPRSFPNAEDARALPALVPTWLRPAAPLAAAGEEGRKLTAAISSFPPRRHTTAPSSFLSSVICQVVVTHYKKYIGRRVSSDTRAYQVRGTCYIFFSPCTALACFLVKYTRAYLEYMHRLLKRVKFMGIYKLNSH